MRYLRYSILIGLLSLLATACGGVSGTRGSQPTQQSGNAQPTRASAELPPIQVESVNVSIGQGSPIPVDVEVSGTWPHLCAQLARTELSVDGTAIEIRLLATETVEGCPEDRIGLPFRLAFPLNVVEMDPATYTVTVNGVSTTLSWDPAGSAGTPSTGESQLTYIGQDGNVHFRPALGAESRQITNDATGTAFGAQPDSSITYFSPQVSSDGEWVAYRRDVGIPRESHTEFSFGLWVHSLSSGESRQVIDQSPAGFAWKPGTHLLTYGLAVPEGYFSARGTPPDASLARGVMAFDADTGETVELVRPERGLALYNVNWSPNGRFLGFDELVFMEGRGPFAYYDFEGGEYVAWEEAIGNYAWSPDGSQVAYDQLTYTATGTEEIYVRALHDGNERRLTDFPSEIDYASFPSLSPDGQRIAYLAGMGGLDSQTYSLFVQDLAGGKSTSLGTFDNVLNLSWSPDGAWLLFSAGSWDAQQLIAVDVSDGSATELGPGTMPDVLGPVSPVEG